MTGSKRDGCYYVVAWILFCFLFVASISIVWLLVLFLDELI